MDRRLRPFGLIAALLAGACAHDADYPSLAVRPIEKLPVTDEPAGAPAAPDNAPLPPEAQSAVAAAAAGDARFRDDLGIAANAVAAARGAAPDSEAWVAAQQALSRAQAARTPVTNARDALDAALTASQLTASPAITAAIERIDALDSSEGAALAALIAQLSDR